MGAAGLSVVDMLSLWILNREQQLAVVFNPVLDPAPNAHQKAGMTISHLCVSQPQHSSTLISWLQEKDKGGSQHWVSWTQLYLKMFPWVFLSSNKNNNKNIYLALSVSCWHIYSTLCHADTSRFYILFSSDWVSDLFFMWAAKNSVLGMEKVSSSAVQDDSLQQNNVDLNHGCTAGYERVLLRRGESWPAWHQLSFRSLQIRP